MYKIYQIDAFTDKIFSGNPAAVCPLAEWPDNRLLQNIAMKNNLAETAFYVKKGSDYEIRWFTPAVEVALCGHATLAAAYVLFHFENYTGEEITFHTRQSGLLKVRRDGEYLTLNFPSDTLKEVADADLFADCFNIGPEEIYKGNTDYMLVFEHEDHIRNLQPDLRAISRFACRGIIVTARGSKADFVSRFFAPQSGIDEDPVTGSSHTSLIPYWAGILGKNEMTALQLSQRGGFLKCRYLNDRVEISGQAKIYMTGEIEIGFEKL